MVLDGAHNPARGMSAQGRRATISRKDMLFTRAHCSFGVLRDKAYQTMAEILFPDFDEIVLVKPDSPAGARPQLRFCRWAPAAKICHTISSRDWM
jgi:folylpolyglutamate synthase/dihydropteroate synthase